VTEHSELDQRWTPPALYLFLELPFGAAVGFLMIAVPFWLSAAGVPLADIAKVSAVGFMPHALKIVWVPLIDVTGHRKAWYLGAVGGVAALLAACALIPDPARHLGLLTVLVTALQAVAGTSSAALNALIATTTHESAKGRAGGFYMAGNVGGTGLLGALALWLTSNASPLTAGLVLAGVVLAAGAGAVVIHERRHVDEAVRAAGSLGRAVWRRLSAMVKDIWQTATSRMGFTGVLISLAPVGCGALTNLFSGMAREYGASQRLVEAVNGLGGGLAGALGSLVGGYLADRMNRRLAYALAGGLTALSAVAMLAAPMTPLTYTWGTLAYNFANGIAFATWAGMVLEVVGLSAAVTTKYALFVASSNLAISYVTALNGWASGFRGFRGDWPREAGARGALAFDAMITFAGIGALLVMVAVTRRMSAQRGVAPGGA
jgi:PAT family beta-lactamase induction signal transducer AmpG